MIVYNLIVMIAALGVGAWLMLGVLEKVEHRPWLWWTCLIGWYALCGATGVWFASMLV